MKHIPNILTLFRVALIPFFVWMMLAEQPYYAAGVLILSGITDLLDGFLARRYNWVSDVGKFLDPAADKLTQLAVCIMLLIKLNQYWYFFAALLLRDSFMFTMGAYLLKKGVRLEGARWFGKVGTALFYAAMLLILLIPNMPAAVAYILLGSTTAMAFTAAALYFPQYLKYRQQAKANAKHDKNTGRV